METTPHLAMIPSPGMGHLIPLVEIAKQLVLHQNLNITFFISSDKNTSLKAEKSVLQSLPSSITAVFLPPVSFDDLPPDLSVNDRIGLTAMRSFPSLCDSLKLLSQSAHITALVVDMFGTEIFTMAEELGSLTYVFFASSAMGLTLMLHSPKLDADHSCEFGELTEPVLLPGCVPLHGKDFPDTMLDKKSKFYGMLIHSAKRYSSASGIFVNSFLDLEPEVFKALKKGCPDVHVPPVYPVGPLIRTGSSDGGDDDQHGCLKWLDQQPRGSVIFISFGSGGTLSHEQLNELAFGLELSGQRFLWAVKAPNENIANAAYFGVQSNDPSDFLPKGFLERTKGLGLVVPAWAPQVEILAHGSTGGFLTHCGWNSTLESIVHGVPLIAWPLYAEQNMNAVILTESFKVALRVKPNEKGIMGRDEIANCVKDLIEGEVGEKAREKMGEYKDAAAVALSKDGSSSKSLAEVAEFWMKKKAI